MYYHELRKKEQGQAQTRAGYYQPPQQPPCTMSPPTPQPTSYRKGKGITIIPEDKEELLSRLRILIAAKHAGHSDGEDEKHAILQRLLEKGHITKKDYRKLGKVELSRKK